MYIAGLHIPLTHTQGVESIVCLTTFSQFALLFKNQGAIAARANADAGPIKSGGLPTSLAGRFTTPMHTLTLMLPPLAYLGGVLSNGLQQPAWIERWRLPFEIGVGEEASVRTLACIASFGLWRLVDMSLRHLGAQWHYIGVREKPRVVSTGPYGVVRHPLYSIALLHEVAFAAMFWSYAPLIALPFTAIAFAVKIPIEEKLMEDDANIGLAYKEYKQKVPSRIIPYIW